MAHITHDHMEKRGLLDLLAAPFTAMFRGLIWLAEANPKYRQLEKLAMMSDAQLAARGLRRDQIVQHVMGPHGL